MDNSVDNAQCRETLTAKTVSQPKLIKCSRFDDHHDLDLYSTPRPRNLSGFLENGMTFVSNASS